MVAVREVSTEQLLRDSPAVGASFMLPVMISERLDALVERARADGERTDRRELLSALILSAEPSTSSMSDLLREYRTARNRDAALGAMDPGEHVLVIPPRLPGPRRRSS